MTDDNDNHNDNHNNNNTMDNEYIDVSVAQDGGVQKKILEAAPEGAKGPPSIGNDVEAHYTGTYVASYCVVLCCVALHCIVLYHTSRVLGFLL